MFAVDTETIDEIRRAWKEGGELAAITEFRRHFPLVADHARARLCVHTILGWARNSPSPEDKTGQEGER
jgi:hypothetical protein